MQGAMKKTNSDWTINEDKKTAIERKCKYLNFLWTSKYQPSRNSESEYVYLKSTIATRAEFIGKTRKIKVTATTLENFMKLALFKI